MLVSNHKNINNQALENGVPTFMGIGNKPPFDRDVLYLKMEHIDLFNEVEVWKKIPKYSNYYVSSFGNIKNIKTGNLLKKTIRNKKTSPYFCVNLSEKGKTKMCSIHSLVLISFVGKRPKNNVINHIDGNKYNNHINNLDYCTQSENRKKDFTTGRQSYVGEKNNQCKLKEKDVLNIFKLRKSGCTYREISVIYNMAHSSIQRICNGTGWKHLKN